MTRPPRGAGPFAALGLPARAGLTDDEVRAAWRRIAAATHPDRPDGGDPERFAVAAAAYTALRTPSGRGEALADQADQARGAHPVRAVPRTGREHRPVPGRPGLAAPAPDTPPGGPGPSRRAGAAGLPGTRLPGTRLPVARLPVARLPGTAKLATLARRVRRGRPGLLAFRVLIVAAVAAGSAAVAGWQPATPALITGAVTWLLCTARHDLAPPGAGRRTP